MKPETDALFDVTPVERPRVSRFAKDGAVDCLMPDVTGMSDAHKTALVHELLRKRYGAPAAGNGPRYVYAAEVRNKAGFSASRSCDFIAMDTWESGPVRLIGHEVKVSRSDWVHELKQPEKAEAFIRHVAEWWLVVPDRRIVRDGELPQGWGLLAPRGDVLTAIVKPARKPQPALDPGLAAALLRAYERGVRAEMERAKAPRPHTSRDYHCAGSHDAPPPLNRRVGDLQRPRWDLRRAI